MKGEVKMCEQLEIEYKNLLTKAEFKKLQSFFSICNDEFLTQENDYFDTPEFALKKMGCALRIRYKSGTYEMTLKEPREVGLLETNEMIKERERILFLKENIFPSGSIKNKLKQLGIPVEKVVHFGTLKTLRAEIPYAGGLLVLDKSYYLNKEDFEVEYEVDDPKYVENFHKLLETLQIPQRKTDNKVQRFYKEMIKRV